MRKSIGKFNLMRIKALLIVLLFSSLKVFSQTISGYVSDAGSGENLIGVNIYFPEVKKGIATNNYGFYSISLSSGKYHLIASYPGYATLDTIISFNSNLAINIKIKEKAVQLEDVVIKAVNENKKLSESGTGIETINLKSVQYLPSMIGENDIMKVMQMLPGIQSAGEGSSGFNVRGGNYDQNLILLDEAIVYNPGHIFSFISVFNDDAINSMTLYKGSIPASFGGRASSVLDITMKEGNNKNYTGKGSIGLVSSKITLEGPIIDEKSSFIISARRSTIDLLLRPVLKMHGSSMKDNDYYFYDLNAKLNYRFSDNDRLFLSSYIGKDVFNFTTSDKRFGIEIPWGNMTSNLRWNHLFSDKLFMNLSLIHMGFFRDMSTIQEGFRQTKNSDISDQEAKLDLYWYTTFNHKINLGGQFINHTFTTDNDNSTEKKRSIEYSAFIMDEFDLGENWRFNFGIRFNEFRHIGPFDEFSFNSNGEPFSLIKKYVSYETVKIYNTIEPRVDLRYLINKNSSFKISYAKNSQFIHLVSNSGSTLPLDIWIPSSKMVAPQRSYQVSLGYSLNFLDNNFNFTIEGYGKAMQNLLEFGEKFVPTYANNSELDYVFGDGNSHGMELLLKKVTGNLQGWFSYTFSNTDRTFHDLNNGKSFPANTDIRHNITVVATYTLNSNWTFGANFVFKSGKPFSIPTGRFFADGELVDQYNERNNVRLLAYHRLDISATYKSSNTGGWYNSECVFAIFNVYNKMNPAFVYFENKGSVKDNSLVTTPKSVTILPLMPSVAWKFNF